MQQKAIIAGVKTGEYDDFEYSMIELAELARACDVDVVGKVTQNLEFINVSHYIGKGKMQEIMDMLNGFEANMVIFNDELSPSQIRNLEEFLQCKVIDRTLLILDIFEQRSKTKEAQLQVSAAHLQYMLPRLVGLRKSLGRQVGGVGTKNKGVGEKKLELDRRYIEDRITVLNKELAKLVLHRKNQRKKRMKNRMPQVALVGYTNAGKSTLLNAIMDLLKKEGDKYVHEEDMLFATLETSVRRIELPDNKEFLLTDTVGFINKLPHHLIKAFRSTLEEVTEANLLLHVVDYSNLDYKNQIDVTNKTLEEIGVKDVPIIYVYNKSDLMEINMPKIKDNTICISAKKRAGIDKLVDMITKEIFCDYVRCKMKIPYDKGEVVSYFNENANVISTEYDIDGTIVEIESNNVDFKKYQEYVI